ncbi:MAG: trypsin-like peptidase domain-containing protein [Clostridia bacterium]|nr:trypsin-like peptidase domain-containing protein [Clostridia bacterium]
MRRLFYILATVLLLICCLLTVSCDKLSEDADHEHSYLERTFDATCLEDGRREKICIECNDIILLEVLPAMGHTPNDWQVRTIATCVDEQVEERVCKDCAAVVETRVSDPLGHKLGDWQVKVDATCSQSLIEEKLCKVCGLSAETRTGAKITHDYVQAEIKGTCAVGAHILHTCRFCGDSYESNFSEVREAHTEGGWIVEKAPTCIADGRKMQICSVCSQGLSYEPIPMVKENHSFIVESVPPEGENPGYTKYTCKLCPHEFISKYSSNYLPSQIYEMIVSSTVRIESYSKDGRLQGVGSGFFITEDGQIATNFHVIAGAYILKVKTYGGEEYDVIAVKGYDIGRDVAVIQINAVGFSHLELAEEAPKTGDAVYTLGSPFGLDDVFTDGVVSNPNKFVNGLDVVVFSAPVAPGNSGGPLVNGRGEVLGINTQMVNDAQALNFAIVASYVTELNKEGEQTVVEMYAECLKTNAVKVLAYHLMLNGTKIDEDTYVITKVVQPEGDSYGRNIRFIYSSEKSYVVVSVDWVSEGRTIYSFELVLDSVKEKYAFKMFDHTWSQYTAEAIISASVQASGENGVIENALMEEIFDFTFINYPAEKGDPLNVESVKKLMSMAYMHLLEYFDAELSNSVTELTLEHFNFVSLEKDEPELPPEENPELPPEENPELPPEQGSEQTPEGEEQN